MTTVTESITPPTHLNPREADPKRWVALAVIAVAQLMVVLDASIVTIALPSAQKSLHISTDNRQWMVTAYTLAFGGLLLLGGRIADYVGRKRMFIIGLLGFAAASALGGVAVNAPMLFGARALQGAMAALLAPAALSLITVTFTEVKERATAFGVYGAIAGGGAAIGLIMGGILTQYASWRWCLLVNVPIAIMTATRGGAHRPGVQGPRQHQLRHSRSGDRHRRSRLPGLRIHPGRPARLDRHQHPDLPGCSRRAAGRLRDHRAPGQEPTAADAGRPRPHPRRFVPELADGGLRADGDVPLPHLLLPGEPGVLGAEDRIRLPPLLGRHHPGRRGVVEDHPPDRPQAGDGGRLQRGHAGHGVADPDRRPHRASPPTCCRRRY